MDDTTEQSAGKSGLEIEVAALARSVRRQTIALWGVVVVLVAGQVVFMLGNPASMVSSYGYEGERVQGMGDMPLAELRKLAAESLSSPQP